MVFPVLVVLLVSIFYLFFPLPSLVPCLRCIVGVEESIYWPGRRDPGAETLAV